MFSLIRPAKFQAHLCERPMKISSKIGEISVPPKQPGMHTHYLLRCLYSAQVLIKLKDNHEQFT